MQAHVQRMFEQLGANREFYMSSEIARRQTAAGRATRDAALKASAKHAAAMVLRRRHYVCFHVSAF
jgi:hypothetical protein